MFRKADGTAIENIAQITIAANDLMRFTHNQQPSASLPAIRLEDEALDPEHRSQVLLCRIELP